MVITICYFINAKQPTFFNSAYLLIRSNDSCNRLPDRFAVCYLSIQGWAVQNNRNKICFFTPKPANIKENQGTVTTIGVGHLAEVTFPPLPQSKLAGTQFSNPGVGMLISGYFESRDPNRQSRVQTGIQKGQNRRTYGEQAKLTYESHHEYLNFKYMLLL